MTVSQTQFELSVGGSFSEIYVHEGVTAQAIASGTGYTKSTAFTSNGISKNCTADSTNSKITITEVGAYKVECSLSFTANGTNINWFGSLFVDGVEQDKIHFERKIGVGGDYGSTQFGGLVNVTSVPIDIDLRFRHDDGSSKDLTVRYSNMNVALIGTEV